MRARTVLAAVSLAVSSPRDTQADVDSDSIERTIRVLELVIPDARLEVATDEVRWVLSWPVAPYAKVLWDDGTCTVELCSGTPSGIRLTPFAELQFVGGRESPPAGVEREQPFRLAAGARTTWFRDGASPLAELGGVVGSDGPGGFVGVGAALWGDYEFGVSLSIVARATQTTDERRFDFALDFQLPFGADLRRRPRAKGGWRPELD